MTSSALKRAGPTTPKPQYSDGPIDRELLRAFHSRVASELGEDPSTVTGDYDATMRACVRLRVALLEYWEAAPPTEPLRDLLLTQLAPALLPALTTDTTAAPTRRLQSPFDEVIRRGWTGLSYLLLQCGFPYLRAICASLRAGKFQLVLTLLSKTSDHAALCQARVCVCPPPPPLAFSTGRRARKWACSSHHAAPPFITSIGMCMCARVHVRWVVGFVRGWMVVA